MVALMFWLSAADQIVVTSSPIAVADNRIGTAAAATLMIPVLMKPSPVAPAMMRGSAIRLGLPSGFAGGGSASVRDGVSMVRSAITVM
jgi:hypothetical protein